jgi:hypothetical protein
MNKILYYAIIGLVLTAISCKEDFLENISKQNLNDATQFANENNADIFLNDIYNNIWKINNSPDQPDLYTDDCDGGVGYWPSWSNWKTGNVYPSPGNYVSAFNYSSSTSGSGFDAGADTYADWIQAYTRIRKCNTFIQQANIYSANFKDENGHPNWLNKRIDEARYLRAFTYSYLFMHYGGLPIITHPQSRTLEGDSAVQVPRSTFEETFNFIASELDSVIKNNALDIKYNNGDVNAGRATLGAALALKGWIELFAASPAYNSDVPAACNGTGATPEQVKLTGFGNYDVQRWAIAAATNKKFIDSYEGIYQLFPDLNTFWTEDNEYNSEVIFDRQHIAPVIYSYFLTYGGGPVYIDGVYYNWGNFCPTQELVDDFGMANGKGINDAVSGYDPQNPYVTRDPRFYNWIVYDGAIYKMNWMTEPDTIYTRIDKVNPSKNEIDFAASDVSNTAYYSKKRVNPDVREDAGKFGTEDGLNYVFFRYAEVLLNFAEAQNEAEGPDASVYSAIDKIRVRAGVPTLEEAYGGQTLTREQMRDVIHRERRVELCFENKRIYDILRWRIAEDVLNKVLHGMKISNTAPDDNSGTWTYESIPLELGKGSGIFHPHVFTNKMYFLPVPQNAMDRNPKMIQNPGY